MFATVDMPYNTETPLQETIPPIIPKAPNPTEAVKPAIDFFLCDS